MEEIAKYDIKKFGKTEEMARLKPGFLIKEMLDRFTAKKNGTLKPNRSLHIYSCHDTTIASILNALGVFEVNFL